LRVMGELFESLKRPQRKLGRGFAAILEVAVPPEDDKCRGRN
jgi:hypothetical protein